MQLLYPRLLILLLRIESIGFASNDKGILILLNAKLIFIHKDIT